MTTFSFDYLVFFKRNLKSDGLQFHYASISSFFVVFTCVYIVKHRINVIIDVIQLIISIII
jgi:hypothetical protein